MTDRTYKLRRAVGVPAEVAGSELDRINEKRNGLRPVEVVEEARPKRAPLHPAFEWDDKSAAQEHRLWQARNLIRAVHVIDEKGNDTGSAFVHVTIYEDDEEEEQRVYRDVREVVVSADLFTSAVGELQQKLELLLCDQKHRWQTNQPLQGARRHSRGLSGSRARSARGQDRRVDPRRGPPALCLRHGPLARGR